MACLAFRRFEISRCLCLAVDAQLVSLCLFFLRAASSCGMTGIAIDGGNFAMRITGYLYMTIGTCELAVLRLLKFFRVDISRHSLLTMAGKAVFFCNGERRKDEACKNEKQSSLHEI